MRSRGRMRRMRSIRTAALARFCALVVVPLASCARSEPPPGTRPDNSPPRPEMIRPQFGAEVPGFDGFARVQFDEPLSNPRNLGRDIVGSPAGRWEVKPGRRGLEVRPADGWRDSVVYYIRLPAGVTDLLRNRTTGPVEWLFSTGGAVPDTEVSGRVIDRITARGSRGLRLLFLGADSVPYTAVSDTGGIFRLPGLPFGAYEAIGFQDQNRNFAYDAEFEAGGRAEFSVDEVAPTADVRVVVLPADTTPPVLSGVSAPDSVTLRLEFDDPLDPEADLAAVTLAVRDTLTGQPIEVAEFGIGMLPPPEPDVEAEPEIEPEEPIEPERPDPIGLEPAADYLTVRLAESLSPGVYEAEVDGAPNLRGLRGGGSRTFAYQPPPEPEPEAEAEPGAEAGPDAEGESEPEPEPESEP